MLAKTSPAMKLPVVLCLCLAAGVPFPAGAQQAGSPATALVTRFSYCTVTDMEDHKIWASPVFEFSYDSNAGYGPTGIFERIRGLETEFHQIVGFMGGAGSKSCWAGSETRAEVEARRSQWKAEWTKRVFLWASEWQDVPFTPKPWSPEAAAAAALTAPATTTKYFHCSALDVEAGKAVATRVFERSVSTANATHAMDMALAFTDEFRRQVLPAHGVPAKWPTCEASDTLEEANKTLAEFHKLWGGWLSGVDIVDVAWQPTVQVEPRAAAAPTPAVAQTPAAPPAAATTAAVPSAAPASQGAIDARIDALNASSAQALGLDAPQGALVVSVAPGGAADKAGLKPLDVIVEIAGQPVKDAADFAAVVARMRPGYRAPLRIKRNRALKDLSVKITAAPVSALPAAAAPATAPVAPASTFVRGWAGWAMHTPPMSRALAAALGLDAPRGVMLIGVFPDHAAARAGLQPFDVVLAVNGRNVNSAQELTDFLKTLSAGSDVLVTVWRQNTQTDIKLTLSATQPALAYAPGSTGYCYAIASAITGAELDWISTVVGVPSFSPDPTSASSQQLSEQFRAYLHKYAGSVVSDQRLRASAFCMGSAQMTSDARGRFLDMLRKSGGIPRGRETIEVLWVPQY